MNTGHSYSPIDDMMEIITILKKGKHLNTVEKYHIYCAQKENRHLNDTHTDSQNSIFNFIHNHHHQ
jgi:hypothetical protein